MYDELVRRLREADEKSMCSECGLNLHTGATKNGVLFAEAADAIEELQAAEKKFLHNISILETQVEQMKRYAHWIPVTERLPEIHVNVLVMDKAHDMAVGSLEKLWDGEVWVCPFADVEDEQCPITHWMPLPQPPKEET